MPESTPESPAYRYLVAVALILTAVAARWLLLPVLGPSTPFILLAITISAWHGGLGPGLLATFLSCLALIIFQSPMTNVAGHTPLPIWPLIASVFVMGTLISGLLESLHRAQKQTAETARKLAEINERFHLMVNSVKDYGIFMLDEDGYVVSWNNGAQSISGYKSEEIIGQHFSRFYPPEDVAAGKPETELEIATETGRFEEEGWRLRKDGSRFRANVVITAVRDDTGKLRGFSKVTRDMTERRKAEESAQLLVKEQIARTEAEAANKAKDQFLSVLSHELRTPLNSITGWISLLRDGGLDENTTQTAFESIDRSSKAQTRLVEDLLDVSRMLAGKLSIDVSPIELNSVIAAVVERLRPSLQEKSIALETRYYPTVVYICGDLIRLEQVVSNLLENAIKFTPENGRVVISLSKVDSRAEIEISDNGIGITADVLPHIFENFRQADSSHTRSHGGLGLGLAIVHYMVEAHHGTIRATSAGAGRGATFTVQFPLLESNAQMLSELPWPSPHAGANVDGEAINPEITALESIDLHGTRVLLVDKEADILDVFSAILTHGGADVKTANSIEEALSALSNWKPDVVVADIETPYEKVFELLSRIRNADATRDEIMPAVALAAYAGESQKVQALGAGFQEYLVKPVEPEVLLATVARLARKNPGTPVGV